jgi:hypothetical protein
MSAETGLQHCVWPSIGDARKTARAPHTGPSRNSRPDHLNIEVKTQSAYLRSAGGKRTFVDDNLGDDNAQIAVTHAQPVRARVSEELLFGGSYKH